ncbi:MAG TPA: YceI family protein [Polyangia bacterium]|nr:YceI family protein [Polyangia bacterium]
MKACEDARKKPFLTKGRAGAVRIALVAGTLLAAMTLPAKDGLTSPAGGTLTLAPGASLELDGDSTLHHYSAKAHGMWASAGLDAGRLASAAQPPDLEALIRGHFIRTFQLIVPVAQLRSGEDGLDKNMRKALKGNRFKEIRFQMDSYDVAPPSGGPIAVTLHGRLSLAGVERKIDVGAIGTRVKDGLQVTGSKDLLMTDYQIKPPTMMFGAIKTKNLITVKFNATLQRASQS